MRFGASIDRPVEVGERDIDDVRMVRRYAEQRASAVGTERAAAMLGGLVARELIRATVDRHLASRDGNPGHICRAVIATAHAAMAVTAERGRHRHREPNRTAQTPTSDFVRRRVTHLLSFRFRGTD